MPLISLLTDFGLSDSYVAQMKGVILCTSPQSQLQDLSHQIPHADIEAASYFLEEAAAYFPEGSIHIAVVDPGVGTKRRALVLELQIPHPDTSLLRTMYFIGPDNGVFTGVLSLSQEKKAFCLPQARRAAGIGRTFDGRDLFAPTAARLAEGEELSKLGQEISLLTEPLVTLKKTQAETQGKEIRGLIRKIDSFGNAISNIALPDEASLEAELCLEKSGLRLRIAPDYLSIPKGEVAGIVNSAGYLEIAANCASAQELENIEVGDVLTVKRS